MRKFKTLKGVLGIGLALCLMLSACSEAPTSESNDPASTATDSSGETDAPEMRDVTLTMMREEHTSQPFASDAPVFEWIKEATGITVEFNSIPSSDYVTKASTLIATDDMPDIMLTVPNAVEYAKDGAFVSLSANFDKMPNFSQLVERDPEIKKLYTEDDLFLAPMMKYRALNIAGRQALIRIDLLEELDLEMPTNYDELLDVLRAFKEAYPDSYPYSTRHESEGTIKYPGYNMGYGNQDFYFDHDINGGEWACAWLQPNFIKGLEFFATMYSEGILDPDYATMSPSQWQEKMSSNIGFFTFENPTFAVNWNTALQETNPEAEFGYVPILENWDGVTRTAGGSALTVHGVYSAISASSEHIDDALFLLDWFYSEEGMLITNWGIEGETYEMVDGEPQWLPESLAEAENHSDRWRGLNGVYGMGDLGAASFVDDFTNKAFVSESALGWFSYWANEPTVHTFKLAPAFTEEESETVADIRVAVQQIFDTEIDKYITGVAAPEDFVSVQEAMIEAGALEAAEIYNTAEARAAGN